MTPRPRLEGTEKTLRTVSVGAGADLKLAACATPVCQTPTGAHGATDPPVGILERRAKICSWSCLCDGVNSVEETRPRSTEMSRSSDTIPQDREGPSTCGAFADICVWDSAAVKLWLLRYAVKLFYSMLSSSALLRTTGVIPAYLQDALVGHRRRPCNVVDAANSREFAVTRSCGADNTFTSLPLFTLFRSCVDRTFSQPGLRSFLW